MPEQYTYQVGKINFIVTPVYKDKRSGETMKDISTPTRKTSTSTSASSAAPPKARIPKTRR